MNAPAVLLTLKDIVTLKEDYEADVRLLEELPARIKLKKRKYEAALFFAPPGWEEILRNMELPEPAPADDDDDAHPDAEGGQDGPEKRKKWTTELVRLLEASESGITRQEALAKLKASGLAGSEGDKGFYGAIAKLEFRNQLVKVGNMLYAPLVLAKLQAEGKVPRHDPETLVRPNGSAMAALAVLKDYPEGLDANALRTLVGNRPGAAASILRHHHYIYNVLGTLLDQKSIVKEGEIYKLAIQGGSGQ